ncbi:ParB/RepB/Spo0J family partition protein [Pseudogemmobacter humi]|uniref:ParB-like nuclease domain protein n=1 Tax=Pseudogemmobacter humi TaxID=2483812 RepID=A0A3P5WVX9_9RHOB|nr:ParB/RepB/Spo0J family partition protein [Pseudogemmobacter humi]VDC20147.1 ParB-like nuclease domain protein [Pseudogemmobacter humi]
MARPAACQSRRGGLIHGQTPHPVAPIAQVAAETASERAEAARDRQDAGAFRYARARGLVLMEIPLDEIEADALVRDRAALSAEEMEELKSSIARNGLRLPVEVFALPGGGYGLLSGYRRVMAFRALKSLTKDARYDRIRAILREPGAMGGAFAAMVEENEIRAGLSQFERGRIAVIAAQQGAFLNVEAAVDGLFPMASRAKRSKIRSFALIFEELGDMLAFPDSIREKDGLRLATALREGAEARLREHLACERPETPEEEAALIEAALAGLTPKAPDPRKGGRPRRAAARRVVLSSGYELEAQEDARGWSIRLGGRIVDRELVETVIREISRLLERP